MKTIYEIRNNGVSYQTDNTEEADEMSKQGASVKAKSVPHSEIVSQTKDHKGTLVLSHSENWAIESNDPQVVAGPSDWVALEEWL